MERRWRTPVNCWRVGKELKISMQQEITKGLKKAWIALTCPVCHERLPTSVVSCVSGHIVCDQCGRGLSECPTCRQHFSDNDNVTLQNILEVLPKFCKHRGCKEVQCDISTHERVCGFRPTACIECDWKGTVNLLHDHVQENHKTNIFNIESALNDFVFSYKKENVKDTQINYSYTINKQVFWITLKNSPSQKTFSLQFTFVATEETSDTYIVTVAFQSPKVERLIVLKLSLEDDSKENNIVLHSDTLEDFTEKGGTSLLSWCVEKNIDDSSKFLNATY